MSRGRELLEAEPDWEILELERLELEAGRVTLTRHRWRDEGKRVNDYYAVVCNPAPFRLGRGPSYSLAALTMTGMQDADEARHLFGLMEAALRAGTWNVRGRLA